MSNTFMIVLGLVVGGLAFLAKLAFGVEDLQPDLLAVATIAPLVSVASLLPIFKNNAWLKAALSIALGIAAGVVGCTLPIGLCLITGAANGLMACGLWSAGRSLVGK